MQKQQICKEDLQGQFRILYDGTWYHEGRPIKRLELVKLFSTILQKEGDGYVLKTPYEVAEVIVDDAPYVITQLKIEDKGNKAQKIQSISNLGHVFEIRDPDQIFFKDGKPYLKIEKGLYARFNTSTYYELVDLIAFEDDNAYLYSYDQKYDFDTLQEE